MPRLRMHLLVKLFPSRDVHRLFSRRQLGADQVLVDLDPLGLIGIDLFENRATHDLPLQLPGGLHTMLAGDEAGCLHRRYGGQGH